MAYLLGIDDNGGWSSLGDLNGQLGLRLACTRRPKRRNILYERPDIHGRFRRLGCRQVGQGWICEFVDLGQSILGSSFENPELAGQALRHTCRLRHELRKPDNTAQGRPYLMGDPRDDELASFRIGCVLVAKPDKLGLGLTLGRHITEGSRDLHHSTR